MRKILKWLDALVDPNPFAHEDLAPHMRAMAERAEAAHIAKIAEETAFRRKIEVACTQIEVIYNHLIAEQMAKAQTSQIKRQVAPPKDRTWEQEQQEAFNALDDSGGL